MCHFLLHSVSSIQDGETGVLSPNNWSSVWFGPQTEGCVCALSYENILPLYEDMARGVRAGTVSFLVPISLYI